LVGVATILLAACGDGNGATGATAVVDTLANGAVRVVNPADGLWSATGSEPWALVEDLRIGALDGDPHYVFGSSVRVFPGSEGRIWVLDGQASELRLFDRDGVFQVAVGRQGDGPGEFSGSFPCPFQGQAGEVWVEDRAARWHRVDADGTLIETIRSPSDLSCGQRRWLADGRLFAANVIIDPLTRRPEGYFVTYRFTDDGGFVPQDTVRLPELPTAPEVTWVSPNGGSRGTEIIPFAHRPTWVLGPTGDFWVTDGGGAYAIRRQTTAGDTLLLIERAYEAVPLPSDVRAEGIAGFGREGWTAERGFDTDLIPRVFPPFDRYRLGPDGTLWVHRRVEGGVPTLDIFSPDGVYLGQPTLPPDFADMTIEYVGTELLYAVARDELDVPYVVRLRVRRPEG
jgi:hypothetical protein